MAVENSRIRVELDGMNIWFVDLKWTVPSVWESRRFGQVASGCVSIATSYICLGGVWVVGAKNLATFGFHSNSKAGNRLRTPGAFACAYHGYRGRQL